MKPQERCDEAAASLARAYAQLGMPAFVLYVAPDGNVRTIGPQLNPETVARMLHTAADAYLAQASQPTLH